MMEQEKNIAFNEKPFTEKDATSLVQFLDDFIDKRAKYHYNEAIERNLNIASEPKEEYKIEKKNK